MVSGETSAKAHLLPGCAGVPPAHARPPHIGAQNGWLQASAAAAIIPAFGSFCHDAAMLTQAEVDQVVGKAAEEALKGVALARVYSEPALDSDGRDALLVTIVLGSGQLEHMNGDKALDAIVRIQHALLNSGEERFPIIDFATEEELALELLASAIQDSE